MKKTNKIEIALTLTEQGLKKFNVVPTFKNLLHNNQIASLKIGENILTVNHSVWGSLQRVCGYDSANMNVGKTILN